jgi:crotonobetainyl-CoA:carnitine CoA-transferase CaiB-like acyl-CoA transferase
MLEGLRVLDLSRVVAGPYATLLLADLGADVIKVERPGRGDDLRHWGGEGMSAVFAAINRNKRSVALDLAHPEGARVGLALARRADVIVENFLPGVADRLGVGYAAVSAVNPGVVYVSITGFGQDGPYAGRPGYNSIAQAMSGLMALTGMPGHPPTKVGGSVADLAAAYLAFGAVGAALVERARTGRGRHLDVNLLAATLGLLPDPVAQFFAGGRRRPAREGNRNPNLSPAEAFETADGLVNIVVMNPEQWRRFCAVLDDPTLAGDPRFAANEARLAHREAFRARVESVLRTAPTAEWVRRFNAAGVACGPVYEFDEVFEDPQVRHLGLVAEVDQPGLGRVAMLGFPYRASGFEFRVRRPAPALGEHTAEVLREVGVSEEELAALVKAGVAAVA